MLKSIRFENFKALRDTTLPLGPFTLIVGPNGSGKSSALQALRKACGGGNLDFNSILSAGALTKDREPFIRLTFNLNKPPYRGEWTRIDQPPKGNIAFQISKKIPGIPGGLVGLLEQLSKIRVYALDPFQISNPISLQPTAELGENGRGLANVLDRIRDTHPERFEALNRELHEWLPEYDRILFEVPKEGQRSLLLRTAEGGHAICAKQLSDGTLLALTLLTIAYLPDPPPIIGLEDPDHGIHPRLLSKVRDAIYRLVYPKEFGEEREPIQVVATTHSPYFLDLFKDHPEEIVLANKQGLDVQFVRLSDQPNINEIVQGSALGEVWYSGILGGVPNTP